MFVVGCLGDDVILGDTSIGKQSVLEFAVMFDILSVIILLYFFSKISSLNEEFLKVYDDNHIKMTDFAIQCNDVLMDKHTQDSRLVKMKIWLHFTRIINKAVKDNIKENGEELFKNQVVDVTLSITTQPKLQMIFKMEQT
jgi:hypothetical protein